MLMTERVGGLGVRGADVETTRLPQGVGHADAASAIALAIGGQLDDFELKLPAGL